MVFEQIGSIFGEKFLRRLQRKLREASLNFLAEEYAGLSVVASLVALLLLIPLGPISLLLSLLLLSVLLYLPSYLAYVRARRAERELPFFLKSLSTLLKSGLDPLSSLEVVSRAFPVLGKSFTNVLSLKRSGISLKRAIEREAESFSSERVKRTLLMVGQVVEEGYGVESLDRYADALLSSKRVETKEFSSKLALYTLAFIALTALAPSILLMYSLLMPLVFKTPVDLSLTLFVLFFAVPLLTVVLLGYISAQVG